MARAALLAAALLFAAPAAAADASALPWWIWLIVLFAVTFALGIVTVLAGIGGGVLFVPIVGAFFPFHVDFVRGAGLLLALSSSMVAGPDLLRSGLANLRLVMPLALAGSIASIAGALLGLALPAAIVQTALGVAVLAIAMLMWRAQRADFPEGHAADRLADALGLHGAFHDPVLGRRIDWKVHRTASGLAAFALIGAVGGLFGVGAGWANVPALNLLMGAPLKMAVASSNLAIPIVNAPAVWIYFDRGAVLPIIAVPSIVGVMLGARIGVRLLRVAPAATIRRLVIALLLAAGLRALLKGTGIWG